MLATAGCVGFSVGTDDDEFFRWRGLGTAYAAVPGIDDYDGKIIRVGLLSRAPAGGQLAGIDVWPLCSIGVGLVGARVRVLPFEVGAGVLLYEPRPIRRDLSPRRRTVNEVHDAEDVPIRPIPRKTGAEIEDAGSAPKGPPEEPKETAEPHAEGTRPPAK